MTNEINWTSQENGRNESNADTGLFSAMLNKMKINNRLVGWRLRKCCKNRTGFDRKQIYTEGETNKNTQKSKTKTKEKREKYWTHVFCACVCACVCRFNWAIKPAYKSDKISQMVQSNIVNLALFCFAFIFVDRFFFCFVFKINHIYFFILIASYAYLVSCFHSMFVYLPLCLHWKTTEAHKKTRFIFFHSFFEDLCLSTK